MAGLLEVGGGSRVGKVGKELAMQGAKGSFPVWDE